MKAAFSTSQSLHSCLRNLTFLCIPFYITACGGGGDSMPINTTGYSIGGTLTGLNTGNTVVLQNNGGDDLTLTSNSSFTFLNRIKNPGTYAVTVKTQPNGQTCTVINSSGVTTTDISNISVTCGTPPTSGVNALAGEWQQNTCTKLGTNSSARTLYQLTATGSESFSWASGIVQYANGDCAGIGSALPATAMSNAQITSIKSSVNIASHWTTMTLITNTKSYLVWSKLNATTLCVIGDENPSLFATPEAVLKSINVSPNQNCFTKR